MELKNKNILVISPEPWEHIFVSKHHYAIQLARRGNIVFFMNPPNGHFGMRRSKYQNVYVVDYEGFPRGLRFYPNFIQRKVIRSTYRDIERVCGVRFDVVWSFDNSVFYDFSALSREVIKISHIVDFNQDFQTAKAAATADVCLAVTAQIAERLRRYNERVHKINHGFCPFETAPSKARGVHNGKITAVYAGNLSIPYIDWCLILEVVRDYENVQFLFVGPNTTSASDAKMIEAKAKVFQSPNVTLAGAMALEQLHHCYQSADVLFLAYQEKYQDTQVANTHKLMEYLGTGKVIVATRTSEYQSLPSDMIVMANKNIDLVHLFGRVTSDLKFYNADHLQSQRICFAMDNTYEKQIIRIENAINLYEKR